MLIAAALFLRFNSPINHDLSVCIEKITISFFLDIRYTLYREWK